MSILSRERNAGSVFFGGYRLKANFRTILLLLPALLIHLSAHSETNESAAGYAVYPEVAFRDVSYSPLTQGGKFRHYLQSTIGPASLFTGSFSAGYNQAVNSVPEWGQGMEGYGKRFASSMGQKTIDNTVHYGLTVLLREDPRYFYSNGQGIWRRAFHAAGETFVVYKDSGGTRPNYSRFAGIASGVCVSRQWRPKNSRSAADYVISAAVSIGAQSAKNVFLEFWPDINKKFLKGKF